MARKHTSSSPELVHLRQRLDEAEETLRAIRSGEVDALVVDGPQGEHVYTLHGADHSYRVLIEAMQQGAVSLSAEGTILYCNRCFSEMVKQPPQRLVGGTVSSFIRPSQRDMFETLLKQARVGASQGEIEFQIPTGDLLPVYVALAPLALPGAVAICMVVTDLTDHKKHRDLEEANRRKDEFLAMLAHELRNPLAPIRNAAGMIHLLCGADGTNPELRYAKEIIERQVQHLSRLVDDLLDVSRLSLGKVKLQLERVELSHIISRAVETSLPVVEGRQHRLTVQPWPEPVYVRADPVRLSQVVSNLLTNAAKYTQEGGQITVKTICDLRWVSICVRDNGIGIPPDLLPHVFDLFIQGDRTLARSEGGLGIGLTLVRRLVEMHGGAVEARSLGRGEGSEFCVHLPLEEHATDSRRAVAMDVPVAPSFTPRDILIVEDNRDGAETLALLLKAMGHEVRIAYTGIQGLELAASRVPDVVLLDIGLPGLSGYEVANQLRGAPQFEQTVLIATSGYGQDDDKRRSAEVGIQFHLVKPLDIRILQSLLSNLPGRR